MDISEHAFETYIVEHLANIHGYCQRESRAHYDRALALDWELVLEFITATQPDNPATLTLKLAATPQSPVHNLPIVIENFGRRFVRVSVNGRRLNWRDHQYRAGFRRRLDRTDLVLFITTQSTKPLTVEIQPVTLRR